MMNVLALSLVLTTLVTAGVFFPSPGKENHKDDIIVKEGYRTVVVEYENHDRSNTRVVISPQEAQRLHKFAEVDAKDHGSSIEDKISDKVENAKEKIKEVASDHLPHVGEGISTPEKDKDGHGHRATTRRELVCDAYGKCKHKIASALRKTKDKVYEKAHEVGDKLHEVEEEAEEEVREAYEKVKDTVREKSHEASDKAHEAMEKVKDGASEISGKAKEAKEEIKEGAKEKAEKVKRSAEELVDTGKTLEEDVEKNTKKEVSEKAKETEEMVEHASDEVKQAAQKLKEEGKRDVKEILRHGVEVVCDCFRFIVSPESMVAALGVLQLLGFATAFGMSIWITFISSYILARALPRQQFAMVQSKIYPTYFKVMAYTIGAVLMGHLLSKRKRLSSGTAETFQGFNLLAALVMVLANLFILEPRATKVMFERMKMEKEESRGKESSNTAEPSARIIDSITEPAITRAAAAASQSTTTSTGAEERAKDTASRAELLRLSRRLKKLNSVSSFLNVLTLMALTWHLVHLGQSLHSVCQC